jgi:hypothetical protein
MRAGHWLNLGIIVCAAATAGMLYQHEHIATSGQAPIPVIRVAAAHTKAPAPAVQPEDQDALASNVPAQLDADDGDSSSPLNERNNALASWRGKSGHEAFGNGSTTVYDGGIFIQKNYTFYGNQTSGYGHGGQPSNPISTINGRPTPSTAGPAPGAVIQAAKNSINSQPKTPTQLANGIPQS